MRTSEREKRGGVEGGYYKEVVVWAVVNDLGVNERDKK